MCPQNIFKLLVILIIAFISQSSASIEPKQIHLSYFNASTLGVSWVTQDQAEVGIHSFMLAS